MRVKKPKKLKKSGAKKKLLEQLKKKWSKNSGLKNWGKKNQKELEKWGGKKKGEIKKNLTKKLGEKTYCLIWVKTYCGGRHIPTNDVYLFLR